MSQRMSIEYDAGPKRRRSDTDAMVKRAQVSHSPIFAEELTRDPGEQALTRAEGVNFALKVADGFERVVDKAEQDKGEIANEVTHTQQVTEVSLTFLANQISLLSERLAISEADRTSQQAALQANMRQADSNFQRQKTELEREIRAKNELSSMQNVEIQKLAAELSSQKQLLMQSKASRADGSQGGVTEEPTSSWQNPVLHYGSPSVTTYPGAKFATYDIGRATTTDAFDAGNAFSAGAKSLPDE